VSPYIFSKFSQQLGVNRERDFPWMSLNRNFLKANWHPYARCENFLGLNIYQTVFGTVSSMNVHAQIRKQSRRYSLHDAAKSNL
jgi:hypothetical protein